MKRILFALIASAAVLSGARAEAAVHVVTTVQTFKLIAEEIGGDHVTVSALVGDSVDPHFVDAKPSYALTLNKADLLVYVGLDLEVGWLPPILSQSRNPGIQAAQPGNLDASTCGIDVRDTGGSSSRAQGDVHPMGNPHYWLPPVNAVKVARCIADRLEQLDAPNKDYYEKNYGKFAAKADKKTKEWTDAAKGLKGQKVVTYHKSWGYLTAWLGMTEIGYIEPKPGVPPDPQHLAGLTRDAKSQGAKCVIVEKYYPRNTADKVAQLSGMKLAVVNSDANGSMHTYWDLVDSVILSLTDSCQ